MASISKSRNKWRVRHFDWQGKRITKSFLKKIDAEAFARIIEGETEKIKRGLIAPENHIRFDFVCDEYLKKKSPTKRNPEDDKSTINAHLKPFFGEHNLSDITCGLVDTYKITKSHLAPKTIHNHITQLIAILNFARKEKMIREVPEYAKPQIKILDEDFAYLKTDDEIEDFLKAAIEVDIELYHLYATAIYTGMRAGELAGLHWNDIDFNRNQILVRFSYDGPPKSGKSRTIPLPAPLKRILLQRRGKALLPTVFCNKAGNPLRESDRVFQEKLKLVLDRTALPKRTIRGKVKHYIVFHDLRHTYASHYMMKGGHLYQLQKILGHSEPKMTTRYAHLSPSAFRDDIERFPDFMGSVETTKVVTLKASNPIFRTSIRDTELLSRVLSCPRSPRHKKSIKC